MTIDFACPHCGWTATLGSEYAGQSGRCPRCSNAIAIPPLDRGAAPVGRSCDSHGPKSPWRLVTAVFLHPLPCALAGLHLLVMLIWVPLALATVNTEAAPLGAGLIAWIDSLAVAVCDWDWLEAFVPAYPWSIVWVICLAAIFGTVQWYAIGAFLVIGFRACRFLRRSLFPNATDECLEQWRP
jgi:hypothetical protein